MTQHPAAAPAQHAPLADRGAAIALCERLHEATAQMTDLLARETALLRENRLQEVAALQPEKAALSQAYARDYGLLKDNARFVGANAPTQADRLRRAMKTLQIEIQHNFTALEATKAVSEGLMNAIFEIARSKRSGPSCYNNSAAMAQHKPTAPTALAIDRSL